MDYSKIDTLEKAIQVIKDLVAANEQLRAELDNQPVIEKYIIDETEVNYYKNLLMDLGIDENQRLSVYDVMMIGDKLNGLR